MPSTPDSSIGQQTVSTDTPRQSRTAQLLAEAQPVLGVLFVASTVALIAMVMAWRGNGRFPGMETPLEVPPLPVQTFWLVLAAATSLASLLGMISNTVFGWRKERREARAEVLERRRQELEIQKLQLEIEREQARDRDAAQRPPPSVGPVEPSGDVPAPLQGEHRRLEQVWAELDREYQRLTRQMAAVDKDLGQTLDSERRLILQDHRHDLQAERHAISTRLAEVERQLAALESVPDSPG